MSVRVELDTSPLDDVRGRLRDLVKVRVQSGIFSEAGMVAESPDLTVAQLLAFHEFGLGVPERSSLRSTAKSKARDAAKLLGQATARVIKGQAPDDAMGVVGEVFTNWVRQTIRQRKTTPNSKLSDATIARKGSTLPLVDTAQLIQSLSPRVVNG